ncbi:MAG TPA: M3 family metallopeptidase [Candidatus Acidoferrales bacterium]|nr:M3 family metallopeptidase [Candidatus Acidoferrales bacterium]
MNTIGARPPRLTPSRIGSLIIFAIIVTAVGFSVMPTSSAQTAFGPSNPFYAPSTLPFQAPPFDKIKDSDYEPAFDAGMAQHLKEIQAIADNPQPPTFENTFAAMEKSGQLLNRVEAAFNDVSQANLDDALQKVRDSVAPKLAAHLDSVFLNPKLFQRIEAIYNERQSLKLDPESLRLVEFDYKLFVHSGARLSDADKTKLKKMNEEESILESDFQNKLLAGTKEAAYHTTDKSALAGLSEAQVSTAAQAAKERKMPGYVIPLQNTTQQPSLSMLSNRATRQALFDDSWNRTERGGANDTRATIARMAQLRAEKAKLLGFPNFAAWNLEDQMAKTPDAVQKFLFALVPGSTANAVAEAKDIQELIDEQKGGFQLQPWDWNYYAEEIRKNKYAIDERQVDQYFELNNVLENGVFYAANQLYGLTFKERKDIPVYNPDMRVFEVFDADGKPLALWYCDYFKRDNKAGGAWMDVLVQGSKLLGTLPVVYNVANFAKPAPGQPALLTFDDVTTMFHEFGHALHGMFGDTEYPTLAGTNVPRDFVEFPSQFNEHWATYPAVFDHYAKNYKTGAPMPAELAEKIKKTKNFNQGYDLTELLAAAELDMQWHILPASAPLQNPDAFEKQALEKTHLALSYVPPRYRSSYFLHIWANGYAAGYYAYLWSEMLDDNAFQWFETHGGMTRANGDRFRKMVLSRGDTEDLAKMYAAWLGAQPSIEPMLKYRGLAEQQGSD